MDAEGPEPDQKRPSIFVIVWNIGWGIGFVLFAIGLVWFGVWASSEGLLVRVLAVLFGPLALPMAWESFHVAWLEWTGNSHEEHPGPFDWLSGWMATSHEPSWRVDDHGVQIDGDGDSARIDYRDLERVEVMTTDGGPYVEEFFVVLEDSRVQITVPGEVANDKELVERILTLPEFDYEAFVEATGSVTDEVFLCWEASWGEAPDRLETHPIEAASGDN